MNEVWLSIKAWTQRLILAAAAIYAAIYIYKNTGDVQFWYWFKHVHTTSVFMLTSGAFVAGIIFTIIATTAWRTVRQIRELHSRGRQDKLEREISDMKTKAAMLQTRPSEQSQNVVQ